MNNLHRKPVGGVRSWWVTAAFLGAAVTLGTPGAARGQQGFFKSGQIAIPDLGPASPFPSQIAVTGLKRGVAHVSVSVYSLSHTYPADLSFLLVGPHGQTCLLSNRCGGSGPGVVFATACFDDDAADVLPAIWPSSGCYRTRNCGSAPVFAAPAPPGPYGSNLSAFEGTDGNGVWSLYVEDFASGDSGSVHSGWAVFITEAGAPLVTLSGQGATIPSGASPTVTTGSASPYPSQIAASGLTGKIASVSVRLDGLSHTYPQDLDVLLVGPNGQRVMLMSDAGGSGPGVTGAQYSFTDIAPGLMPSSTAASGTYRPTDYGASDALPAPAPVGPYGTSLGVFDGANPNGVWSLYIYDDQGGDFGYLTSWRLNLYLAEPCEADFNKSGSLTVADIFAFLTAWFAGCP